MSDSAENEAGAGEKIPEIELIIKASTIDGKRKGACLFCQVNMMMLNYKIFSTNKLWSGVFHGFVSVG